MSTDPKGEAGKLKCPLHLIPTVAMEQSAWVHALGAEKYGPWNWRQGKVCASTYISATMRHMNLWRDGQDLDEESKRSHLAHIITNCNILLDAAAHGTLEDDRNTKKLEIMSTAISTRPYGLPPNPNQTAVSENKETIPCDICGGSGLTPGWMPSYSNPDNAGCDESAEPCDCGNWQHLEEQAALATLNKWQNERSSAEEWERKAWDNWNEKRIALFRLENPEIAAEVDAINYDKSALDHQVKILRGKLTNLDLKLPQYFLKI